MRVTINEQTVNIPSSLREITLQQRIDYQRQHGDELDEKLKVILEMPESMERELELIDFQTQKMFRTVAFFAGVQTEVLQESSFINEISGIYYGSLAALFQDEDKLELQREFVWKGEIWQLQSPELKNGDKMKTRQLIEAKQTVQQMNALGQNHWEALIPLCAIYLLKKDEQFDKSFLYEGSERQELMKSLPMDIAMQVGFFLQSTINIYLKTFRSFLKAELGIEM